MSGAPGEGVDIHANDDATIDTLRDLVRRWEARADAAEARLERWITTADEGIFKLTADLEAAEAERDELARVYDEDIIPKWRAKVTALKAEHAEMAALLAQLATMPAIVVGLLPEVRSLLARIQGEAE